MRGLERNKREFWYCLLKEEGTLPIIDQSGNEIGTIPYYDSDVSMRANISPATGYAQNEMFGNLDSYDKVIVTTEMDCPIDEHTVLFIDKEPEYGETIVYPDPSVSTVSTSTVSTVSYSYAPPLYDYVVKRVAKSLNSISIAVRKVDVS